MCLCVMFILFILLQISGYMYGEVNNCLQHCFKVYLLTIYIYILPEQQINLNHFLYIYIYI